jgi:DNA adenine methylase
MQTSKWIGRDEKLGKWLVQHLPRGQIYIEPFADIISPLWYLPKPFPVEVINDLYLNIVNIYRTLQDVDKYNAVIDKLTKAPSQQKESDQALKILNKPEIDEIDKTWAFFVIYSEYILKIKKGDSVFERFLSDVPTSLPLRLKTLVYWYDRLSRVQIDCVDAIKCIKYWDTPNSIFYIEPPYDLDTEFYENLVDTLLSTRGKVLLFGHEQSAYKKLIESGWQKLHNNSFHHSEVLYLNYLNGDLLDNKVEKQKQGRWLFDT